MYEVFPLVLKCLELWSVLGVCMLYLDNDIQSWVFTWVLTLIKDCSILCLCYDWISIEQKGPMDLVVPGHM